MRAEGSRAKGAKEGNGFGIHNLNVRGRIEKPGGFEAGNAKGMGRKSRVRGVINHMRKGITTGEHGVRKDNREGQNTIEKGPNWNRKSHQGGGQMTKTLKRKP